MFTHAYLFPSVFQKGSGANSLFPRGERGEGREAEGRGERGGRRKGEGRGERVGRQKGEGRGGGEKKGGEVWRGWPPLLGQAAASSAGEAHGPSQSCRRRAPSSSFCAF